jgi:DNA-binding NtrC family response regulator
VDKQILYFGHDDMSGRLLKTTLENRGYELVRASDSAELGDLLRSGTIHAVCIDENAVREGADKTFSDSLKLAGTATPVVLIERSGGVLPRHFENCADAVMDESSFLNFGHRKIEELREARFPVFLQWLEDWKERSTA